MSYDHRTIDVKWQGRWLAEKTFRAEDCSPKPKYYVLDMFPYPSGAGLHVGHPEGYTATDIVCRYKRMRGFNVLHPMGWDAFGLPTENYAIKTGIHPAEATRQNVDNFRRQIQSLGFSYDWDREVNTSEPSYYRWTQWIFLKLFEKGLAYQDAKPINWCVSCRTGLANEEVKEGACERCGSAVEKRPLRQWVLRITDYAERLLADLDDLDWPEGIKQMQRDWIGRSEGADVDFALPELGRGDPGLHHAARHPVRRHLHGARARARPRGAPHHRRPARRGPGLRAGRPAQERPGAHRPRQGQDRRVHWRLRHQPRERQAPSRSGWPTTC